MAKKSGLGRGLDSLFLTSEASSADSGVSYVSLSDIDVDQNQPRKNFDRDSLENLSASIAQHGVLQPIVLQPDGVGRYTIIAGERRFRAARMAGLKEIPAVVMEVSGRQAKEIALIENLQREDLDPVEVANGYQSLIDGFGLTQEEISERLSVPRSTVANSLRILNLPEKILEYIKNGELSLGHAKVILSLNSDEDKIVLADEIVKKHLSVRQAEQLAKAMTKQPKEKKEDNTPSIVKEIEIALSRMHGTPVKVNYKDGKGSLTITFNSEEQFKEIANLLEKK